MRRDAATGSRCDARRCIINPLYQLKITKSLDGRGVSESWGNTYNFETSYAMDSTQFRAYVNSRVALEKAGHYDDVFFLNAYVRRLQHTPTEQVGSDFLSISLTGNGERTNTSQIMPLNIVLVVKRQAALRRSGRIEYRGALAVHDLDFTAQGGFVLKDSSVMPGTQYGHQAMVNALNTSVAGFQPVMPDDPHDFLDYSRAIVAHGNVEVGGRQKKVKRVSPEYALYQGGKREIRQIKRDLYDIIKGSPAGVVDADFLPRIKAMGERIKDILDAMEPKYAMAIIKAETLKALPGGESIVS